MAVLDEAAKAEILRLHQANELTLTEIALRFGTSASTVSKLARVHGLPSRCELRGRAPPTFRPLTVRAKAKLVRRLCDTASMMLEQMELDMRSGKLKAQDAEHASKSVAVIIGSMGKAATTEPGGDAKQGSDATAPAADANELERLQREIIERFESIQRRRNAEAGPGEA